MKIIKIGGSLITDKSQYRKFDEENARAIIREISGDQFILVHGGGSFGHIASKKYGLPGKMSKETVFGSSVVKNDMALLNNYLISIMEEEGIPAIGFSPFNLWNGEHFDYAPVARMYELGAVPVIYGDAFVDRDYVRIESGDDIMVDIARIFKPQSAIFLSDVDGVFDDDPKKNPGARMIGKFNGEEIMFQGVDNDVTGGMMKKFNSMIECRQIGVKTYLINGKYPQRMRDIGKGEFLGTEFV
ncbi:MAG: isopentenyl phosphate kinase [Candidatus Thermoplasmatota archaeon]|jgi:isopentenyl phosphate kinase|nr:isopentenyl phosphate kinase [Candidatus Thermoplasmatota archaeon]